MYDYCIVLGPWSVYINDWQALKNDRAPFKEQKIAETLSKFPLRMLVLHVYFINYVRKT